MIKVKICGLTRLEDIEVVNTVLPDYIGFVFAKSKRQVTKERAMELKKFLDPSIQVVGVFVNEDISYIKDLCSSNTIDIVQLHGDEDEQYSKLLRSQIDKPIIRAIRVKTAEDIERADNYPCDFLLFDAFREDQYGGCGEVFDWNVIINMKKPFFLAGGIHRNNVEDAMNQCNPYCIDVSSGVETDGVKDPDKIKDLIATIRSVK